MTASELLSVIETFLLDPSDLAALTAAEDALAELRRILAANERLR
jgi:hypothetical protein